MKRLFIEYMMGFSFFVSGISAMRFSLSQEPKDLFISLGLNICGFIFYRSLTRRKNDK